LREAVTLGFKLLHSNKEGNTHQLPAHVTALASFAMHIFGFVYKVEKYLQMTIIPGLHFD